MAEPGFYGPDLAHIHDAGFGDYARDAGDGIVAMLGEAGIGDGLVVDLGCGTGILAERLVAEGYDVLGVDISADALAIARDRAPAARFEEASVFGFEPPRCAAVTAVGEILGYAADRRSGRDALAVLFDRVHAALDPGGLFAFDLAAPGRAPEPSTSWREGPGWLVCHESRERADGRELRRRIVTFRETGEGWRRGEELHVLRLHARERVLADLAAAGFEARALDAYTPGSDRVPAGVVVYRAARI
ncbi:MAG TPA: class I SAM-dependent methyltransferase [Solirubrobacterales bacterium]